MQITHKTEAKEEPGSPHITHIFLYEMSPSYAIVGNMSIDFPLFLELRSNDLTNIFGNTLD